MILKDFNFDRKSIGARLCAYFIFFVILAIGIIWLFQTIFLLHYYQGMKIASIKKVANDIAICYGTKEFEENMKRISLFSDIFVQVEDGNTVIFAPSSNNGRSPGYFFLKEMGEVRANLFELASRDDNKDLSSYMLIKEKDSGGKKVLAYARFLSRNKGNEVILYIFSPLYPVDSTVLILRKQLLYVSIISVIIAVIFSVIFSQRISMPIRKITKEAEHLAKGEFNFKASKNDYTQIRHLSEALNEAAYDLKRSERLQRDVLANVSHDLKTPLTMIKSYAEMLRDLSWDSKEKREKHLQVIIDEADRLNLLVKDITAIASLQNGNQPLNLSRFKLNRVLEEIVEKNQDMLGESGYIFKFNAKEDIYITADKEKIKRVVNNLVDNAIKYTKENAIIILNLVDLADKVKVEVADNGLGISEEDLKVIWERYQRSSENHSRKASGTGLGLSIVREIVRAHGGKCGVESELGKGSKFYFIVNK